MDQKLFCKNRKCIKPIFSALSCSAGSLDAQFMGGIFVVLRHWPIKIEPAPGQELSYFGQMFVLGTECCWMGKVQTTEIVPSPALCATLQRQRRESGLIPTIASDVPSSSGQLTLLSLHTTTDGINKIKS